MLSLEELLNPNSFLFIQSPTSKKMVFGEICDRSFEKYNINKNLLLNSLIKREKISSTTIGDGIAISHFHNDKVIKPACIVAILSDGLDFDALDNNLVDLFFLLILPQNNKSESLQILAQLSRLLRNSDITDKLRGCKSSDSAFVIIAQHLKNKAA